MTVRLAINGAAGRMGRALIETCANTEGVTLGAAIEHAQSPFLDVDAGLMAGIGEQNVTISSDVSSVVDQFDVLIDFTRPAPSLNALNVCLDNKKGMVIGTTGFSDEELHIIRSASQNIPVVMASNFSVGVNLTFKLLEMAAEVLGDSVDIEIIEAHHRHKVDAPSGTALSMGNVIADTLGRNLKDCAVYGREGNTGERDRKTIGFATVRAGDVIGEHTAMFADVGERIEITHKASSRQTFSTGAVRAAAWSASQTPDLYNMQDVLGFKKSSGA